MGYASQSHHCELRLHRQISINQHSQGESLSNANVFMDTHSIDAFTIYHASYVGGLVGSSSRLSFYPHTTCQSVPLSRGASIEHPIQPIDEMVCLEILGLHGYV